VIPTAGAGERRSDGRWSGGSPAAISASTTKVVARPSGSGPRTPRG